MDRSIAPVSSSAHRPRRAAWLALGLPAALTAFAPAMTLASTSPARGTAPGLPSPVGAWYSSYGGWQPFRALEARPVADAGKFPLTSGLSGTMTVSAIGYYDCLAGELTDAATGPAARCGSGPAYRIQLDQVTLPATINNASYPGSQGGLRPPEAAVTATMYAVAVPDAVADGGADAATDASAE